jgi:glucose/arabinose dehydrogenase
MMKKALIILFCMFAFSGSALSEIDNLERLELVSRDLSKPWSMVFISNNELLVTEKAGTIRLIELDTKRQQLIKDVPNVSEYGQGGLLDIVLHPQFEVNRWIYLSYSKRDNNGIGTEVLRAKLIDGRLTQHALIFKQLPKLSSDHHFGSRLAFDQQGFLFISLGDRGEKEQAQVKSHHIGKIIRLNDDGSIPIDNPFSINPSFAPEVYSYGHRNMQGLAFNAKTQTLWAHEHGPQGGDELNKISAGKNYGWPIITYGVNYFTGTKIGEGTHQDGMEQPIYYWVPSIASSGMTFCDCEKYPNWRNSLFIGSLKFSTLVRLQLNQDKVVAEERFFKGIGRVRDVKVSPDGKLYFIANQYLYFIRHN